MGIFNKSNQPEVKIGRNTFDGSFASSGTYRFGGLYPILCKEVLPGDTFHIDTAFGLRFMPLAFPIQTKIRADIHYFYVRNRNLWKDWPNFIGMTGSPSTLPYLSSTRLKEQLKTGSLGDYLGLPTTVIGRGETYGGSVSVNFAGLDSNSMPYCQALATDYSTLLYNPQFSTVSSLASPAANLWRGTEDSDEVKRYFALTPAIPADITYRSGVANQLEILTYVKSSELPSGATLCCSILQSLVPAPNTFYGTSHAENTSFESATGEMFLTSSGYIGFRFNLKADYVSDLTPAHALFYYNDIKNDGTSLDSQEGTVFSGDVQKGLSTIDFHFFVGSDSAIDYTGSYFDNISALPFRAYESIYNSFYRDQRNNPYVVNGVQDPNVYLPTTAGGMDNTVYELRYRNWEQDFLTSAVPSPQQGAAPLVGITSTGVATFDSDGTPVTVQLNTADDGDTVVSAQLDGSEPSAVVQSVVDLATQGISINDFRGVNALQRWLETNVRRGLKYKDQLMSHYGVDASYAELDMPEFLGGLSQYVNIDQINNMTETDTSSPLGSYAGQASLVGSSKHPVDRYFDEHGYIIGILSIVPVPTYSQLMPKHFLKNDPLDYFFPEFGHIGYQPIPYKEVCPLQATVYDVDLDSTFGYQRAWYDYLANVDEVHGEFRTTLSQFLLGRVYKTVPSLNEEFLTVHPDQLNDVFTVSEIDGQPVSPILGQIYFDIKMKRKIPRYGIPRLE